jgi:Fungal specific transcription factor domain
VAVRIAHALGLHREKCGNPYTSQHRPFDREMRRRLWWQVTLLDRHATADRGSDPIITTGSFSTQLPLHVNDEDLIPGGWREVHPRDEYTDVTLALVCHEVFDVEQRLNYVPASESDDSQERTDDLWAQRRNWVIESQRRIEEKYLRHCNVTIPAQRGTTLIADIIIATLWLFTYRPLQRRPDSPSSIKISPAGILHLSVEVVEKAMEISMDSATGPFRWISTIWVQWHALAVMTAELCVQTEGPMVERAWTVVGAGFEETARHIADSDKGRLWRPIKKLMTKAQAVRKQYLEDTAAISGSLCTAGALKPAEQTVPYLDAQFSDFKTMETELEPRLMCDSSEVLRQPQQGGTGIGPLSIDWDQLLAVDPSDEMDYNNNARNQMAWTNWETFIDDFQANTDFLPGQEAAFSPSFTMW